MPKRKQQRPVRQPTAKTRDPFQVAAWLFAIAASAAKLVDVAVTHWPF